MTELAEHLKGQLRQLPKEGRAELACFLLSSLDDEPLTEEEQCEVDEAWEKEIARRVAEIESGKAKMIPAEEVFARMRKKYP